MRPEQASCPRTAMARGQIKDRRVARPLILRSAGALALLAGLVLTWQSGVLPALAASTRYVSSSGSDTGN